MDSRSNETRKNLDIEESNTAKRSSSNITSSRRTLFLKLGSASSRFRQLAHDRDKISRIVPSSSRGFPECIDGVFSQKIN
ncbi:hypothetical protein M5689_020524 [Euphorbia peplus]|nr:hypothetical protein M5689_020524 [Euphorbia peplus]